MLITTPSRAWHSDGLTPQLSLLSARRPVLWQQTALEDPDRSSSAALASFALLVASSWRRPRPQLRHCGRCAVAAAAASQAETRPLIVEVEISSVLRHPTEPEDLAIAEVEDPEFPGSFLELVVEAGRWAAGDRGLLLQVGSLVPPKVAKFEGLFRQLAGTALAGTRGRLVGPLTLAGSHSQGLLLPLRDESEPDLSEAVTRLEEMQSRVSFDIGFCGDSFRGSTGSDESVEFQLRKALLQVGVVPAGQKPPFHRLSRTDAGVHARSFRLSVPLLQLQVSDLQPDGCCPGLASALNRRLPPSLRVLEVARIPFAADLPRACVSREYRYYFPRSLMGPGAGAVDEACEMRLAEALSSCAGTRSFLNFSRPDQYAALSAELRYSDEGERWLQELCGLKRRRRERGFPTETRVAIEEPLCSVPDIAKTMTVRNLKTCELLPPPPPPPGSCEGELLCIRFIGEGFLTSMVRLIVGTCLAVARGVLPKHQLERALKAERIVDLSEFLAPGEGLVLHAQHLDPEKTPWLPAERSAAAADDFLDEKILPRVEKAWKKVRSPGVWYHPGPCEADSSDERSALLQQY